MKFYDYYTLADLKSRPPSRGRGLKLKKKEPEPAPAMSPPLAGAWIEIARLRR